MQHTQNTQHTKIVNTTLSKEEMIDFKQTIFSPQIEVFVPFSEMIDPSRLNMTAKQLTQSVISKNTETPYLISKDYKKITTVNSPFMEIAQDDGVIFYNDNELLIYYYKNQKKLITRYLPKYKKLISLSLSMKYIIKDNKFKKGDILWDYTNINTDNFMPKIGYRASIAYMQFFGYNADDAVVVSESFAKKAKIEYSQKVYIPITKLWKYYKSDYHDNFIPEVGTVMDEEVIWYNKIDGTHHFASEITNFSNQKPKLFVKYIEGIHNGTVTNVKVHFPEEINENYFNDQDELYIYNKGLWSELKEIWENQVNIVHDIKREFKKTGLPENKITEIIDDQIKTQYVYLEKIPKHIHNVLRDQYSIDSSKELDALVEIDVSYTAETTRGDKFTNLFAGKATVAMIVPDKFMIKDPNSGKPIDVIFNTLGIPGRNNWGTIAESALSKVIINIEKTAKEKDFELLKEKIDNINENFIKLYDEKYYLDVKSLLNNYDNLKEIFAEDIVKNGFFLYVPNFTRVPYKDLFKNFLEPFGEKYNINWDKDKLIIPKELFTWLREKWNYKDPFNYENDIKIEAQVSNNYIVKLHHTSFSKYNAVDFTTSYNKITGQPTRGRKRNGGQHVSWQSFAAFLAHKGNNAVLKELYTIKSDALTSEKESFIMSYIKNGKYDLKHKYDSITKKTISNALKVFGLKFKDENK